MLVLDKLSKLTNAGKIGLPLFLVGTVFFSVGFSVPNWVSSQVTMTPSQQRTYRQLGITTDMVDIHIGLWEICGGADWVWTCMKTTGSTFTKFVQHLEENTDYDISWFMGTQAMACLALIILICDYVVLLFFISGYPKTFLLASVVLDCVIGLLAFLAAGIFGSNMEDTISDMRITASVSLSWGFAFHIIGGIVFVAAAVCLLVEYLRTR